MIIKGRRLSRLCRVLARSGTSLRLVAAFLSGDRRESNSAHPIDTTNRFPDTRAASLVVVRRTACTTVASSPSSSSGQPSRGRPASQGEQTFLATVATCTGREANQLTLTCQCLSRPPQPGFTERSLWRRSHLLSGGTACCQRWSNWCRRTTPSTKWSSRISCRA